MFACARHPERVRPPPVLAVCAVVFLLAASCMRVQIAESYKGVVVDADSGAPLPGVAIQVAVMRVSSFDGTSQMRQYHYASNERGEFALPARRKAVGSVTERVEQIRYFEVIRFSKPGYAPREFRTEAEKEATPVLDAGAENFAVRLKKLEANVPP